MSEYDDLPQPKGRPQGGLKSAVGRAAYWRMNYESAIGALADLIAEHRETVDSLTDLRRQVEALRDEAQAAFERADDDGLPDAKIHKVKALAYAKVVSLFEEVRDE